MLPVAARSSVSAVMSITVELGHAIDHVDEADVLVHSSAVPRDHIELRRARLGRAVWSRPACLAELMRGHRTVAVAGSHGKTTTSWLAAHLLVSAGRDPLVMVGGSIEALGGGNDWVVSGSSWPRSTNPMVASLTLIHISLWSPTSRLTRSALWWFPANWLMPLPVGCAAFRVMAWSSFQRPVYRQACSQM